jgi:uncharacterized protein YukE
MSVSGLFDFIEDGVEEAIGLVNQQHQLGERIAAEIRRGLQPIQGGAWLGQGARAFTDSTLNFLKVVDQMNRDIESLSQRLQKASQMTLDLTRVLIALINQ